MLITRPRRLCDLNLNVSISKIGMFFQYLKLLQNIKKDNYIKHIVIENDME